MDTIFTIVDSKHHILGIYDNINISLNIILDNIILQFESILEVLEQNNFFKINHLKNNFKISVSIINSNIIKKEIYFCLKNFYFYDNNSDNNFYDINDYTFSNKINKIQLLYNKIIETNNNEQDFNIFIPNNFLDETDTNNFIINKKENNNDEKENNNDENNNDEKENNNDENNNDEKENNNDENNNDLSKLSHDELSKLINDLSNNKKNIENNISDIKNTLTETEENNNELKKKFNIKKKKFDKEKDIYDEYKSRFDANSVVYNTIKNDIINNDLEIPELFINDYNIFKYLEENNIIDYETKLNYYIKNKKDENYNTKYNNLFI